MNKIKKFFRDNKVLLFLGIILVVWLTVFVIIVVVFFYGSSKSKYGNRLDNIKDIPITDKLQEDIINSFKEDELIDSVDINVKGKIIYIDVKTLEGEKVSSVKTLAEESISLFSESILKNYDISFFIKIDKDSEGASYVLMGAKNVSSDSGIIWSDYSLELPTESSAE